MILSIKNECSVVCLKLFNSAWGALSGVFPAGVYSEHPCQPFRVTSKLIKGYPFPSCHHNSKLIKRVHYLLNPLQMQSLVNAITHFFFKFHSRKALINQFLTL